MPTSLVADDFRIDAEYFKKRYLREDTALSKCELNEIRSMAFVTDGPHGYHEVDESAPYAMLTAKCAAGWFADREGADTVADWVVNKNRRSILEVSDIILSTRGTVGKCALVTQEALPAIIDQDVARIALNAGQDYLSEFVLAYLNSAFGQDHVIRNASGMVQQGMSLEKVRSIPVPKLGQRFQKEIAGIVNEALSERRLAESNGASANEALLTSLGLANWTPPEPLAYVASSADAFASGRLDAQYFMPAKTQVLEALRKLPGKPLGERFASIRQMMDPKKDNAPLMVRNYDVTDALQPILDDEKEPVATEEIGSTKKVFKNGDVAISRLRAYLREIAVVRTDGKIPSVGSSEFIVLRPKTKADRAIAPETLLTFLRSAPVQTILKWCQDGSQHPRFSEGDLLAIHLPNAVEAASIEIAAIVQEGFEARRKARALLDAAKRAVEIAIEDSEAVALAYLDKMGAA